MMMRTLLLIVLMLCARVSNADEVTLTSGAKLTGAAESYSRGTLHFRADDGRNLELRITNIRSVKFDQKLINKGTMDEAIETAPKAAAPPKSPPRRAENIIELRDVPGDKIGLPVGMDLAYFAAGSDGIQKHSLPYHVDRRVIMYVGCMPTGTAPFVSIMNESVDKDAALISGSIADSDFGDEDGPVFGSKLIYECGPGAAYADLATQSCKWFIAVVNTKSIPDRGTIELAGETLLKLAKWPKMKLHE